MFILPASRTASGGIGKIGRNIFAESAKGLVSLLRLPIVRTLLLATIFVEIFGFAYYSLLPGFARGVLALDADGLGTLTMMSGFGSVAGVVILSSLGDFKRKGLLIIGVTAGYGIALIAFSLSGVFPVSLVLITGVGAMAACFDAMQWTTLQQNVPNEMRGQVIGGWVFAIGFGWVGPLILGAVGEALGVQWALAGSGVVVALTGIAAYFAPAGLRKM
jgi:predicted MFS family arabinose efflux permease